MRIGILTGGGDAPGLNAVIRGVVRRCEQHDGEHRIVGIRSGFRGLFDDDSVDLTYANTRGILYRGGTVLGTSRLNPLAEHTADDVVALIARRGLGGLIVIGGEGTLRGAQELAAAGAPVVGVPKTIDNDIGGTEMTFGFNTAVEIATEAVDRVQTTAESHDRVLCVEVMGRHVGHIAIWSGIAGGADQILVPEEPFDIEDVCDTLRRRHERGVNFSVVVVSEGALPKPGTMPTPRYELDEYGHERLGGISYRVAEEIERRTRFEARVTVLGHVQRGGTPTAYDRVLATRFGVAAFETAKRGEWGAMVALQGGDVTTIPLEVATRDLKVVSADLLDVARTFFA